jgi:hypothetical protein
VTENLPIADRPKSLGFGVAAIGVGVRRIRDEFATGGALGLGDGHSHQHWPETIGADWEAAVSLGAARALGATDRRPTRAKAIGWTLVINMKATDVTRGWG